MNSIRVIGGGLAGAEAAYQLLKRGYAVTLYEMRPAVTTPAHKTGEFAELVCSNSLKSIDDTTSQGLLKYELRALDSLILRIAEQCRVPAGGALAVERELFSKGVTEALSQFERLTVVREEYTDEIGDCTIVASGPLTSDKLSQSIKGLLGEEELHFYDAAAPIVRFDSVDMERAFFAGRYNKGGEDYINCPMTEEEYYRFIDALVGAERVILKSFERGEVFSACMPVEVMAERGRDSLRFGPLRPVGIYHPETGKRPFAVVQLRKEDNYNRLYNLVGFQTNLKFPEQKRVFSMIPALHDAEFVRFGVMHRNTYINSPRVLNKTFALRKNPTVFFAGQISGVEGYLESAMSGLMAAIGLDRQLTGKPQAIPPPTTMCGSLMEYIAAENRDFQPMHVSFSLVPELSELVKDKKKRKINYSERAKSAIEKFADSLKGE